MANGPGTAAEFFSHFSQEDKPTKTGAWLDKVSARRVFNYIKPASGSSVLEIGPGRGVFAEICLLEGVKYSAVEANRQMAASLEKRGVRVVCATVPPLPLLGSQFDCVVMINVMEHMNNMRDALDAARQIRDVLKPGGKLAICSPDYLNWRAHFFHCDFSHNYVTTRRRLKQLLIDAGFTNATSRFVSGPMTGLACLLATALISRLPFLLLSEVFPDSKFFYKLYKAQLTFLRKVLVIGKRPA